MVLRPRMRVPNFYTQIEGAGRSFSQSSFYRPKYSLCAKGKKNTKIFHLTDSSFQQLNKQELSKQNFAQVNISHGIKCKTDIKRRWRKIPSFYNLTYKPVCKLSPITTCQNGDKMILYDDLVNIHQNLHSYKSKSYVKISSPEILTFPKQNVGRSKFWPCNIYTYKFNRKLTFYLQLAIFL